METVTTPRIARTDRGSGEPAVLLLPGWCSDRTAFAGLVERLSQRRRAVSIDWRGHGESSAPAGDFGTDELVDDALTVMQESGVERVVPVALSHAGWVAIELRRRLGPDAVPGLVLLDWMVLGPPPPFLRALEGLTREPSWQEVRAALFAMWTDGLDIPALTSYVEAMGRHGFGMWSRAGREIAAQFAEHGTPAAALEPLQTPTLHVYAQPDDPALLQAQERYAAEHPWFRVHKLRARSHFPMFEVPDEISTVIEGFVTDDVG